VWLNGHEWAKHQAVRQGVSFRVVANGFAFCAEPERLPGICDGFGPADIQAFFNRWMAVIPTPLTAAVRAGGWRWELSMRQVEVSRTIVFDDPRRARVFFESLDTDNVGVGRPRQVSMVFARPLGRPTKHAYVSRIFLPGTEVSIDFRFKHSRVKQKSESREGTAH
jgi:hypothetical protein